MSQLIQTPNQRKEVQKLLVDNQKLVDKLREICYNTIERCEFPQRADYKDPSWSHEMADKIGYRRALSELVELLSLTEDAPKRKP